VQGGTWVQLPEQRGICSVALSDGPVDSGEIAPRHPVSVVRVSPEIWRVSNGLVEFECSSVGLLQLRDAQGVDQLSAPLRPCRYRDRGEFWDAWDIAAEYRRHPLELEPVGSVQLLESGPLVAQLVVTYRVGASRMRLDLRLKADCPWLELIVSVDWCQRHELLRLDIPLASAAVRLAADTSGGVIERPAHPQTPREQERWEVPAIAWLASQAKAPGGGIAVLLDGPQGVDGATDRLGVSLLRGATWPDPSADQGQQRMRLALMPFQGSWAHAAVPQAAIAFREPGWHGPIAAGQHQASMGTHCWLPAIPSRLCPVALRPDANGVVLQLLNPGASRCRWQPGEGWKVGRSVAADDWIELAPGELIELRLAQSS
jgi:alpha-mannosidase